MEYITHSPEETEALGAEYAKSLKAGDVVAFSGDLYAIRNGIGFAPQLADDLAIHTDLSRCDQFFSLAAGADARMAQYLL